MEVYVSTLGQELTLLDGRLQFMKKTLDRYIADKSKYAAFYSIPVETCSETSSLI
jgi:hypothetical protein